MNDTTTILVVLAVAVVAFILYRKSQEDSIQGALGAGPNKSVDGTVNGMRALGAAAGAAACIGAGAYVGGAQGAEIGAKLAPLCSAVGAYGVPYVIKGAKFVGEKTGEGAVYLGDKAVAAGKDIGSGVTYVGTKAIDAAGSVANNPLQLVMAPSGFAADTAKTIYRVAPGPLKIVAAPPAIVIGAADKVIQTVGGALSSGVKAGTSAVSSVTNKVLGFL